MKFPAIFTFVILIALVLLLSALCEAFPRYHRNDDPAQVSLTYDLTVDSVVSLNIYAPDGHIVRELLHEVTRRLGTSTETWDGRDDAGEPLPNGTYTWKMLATQGLHAHYLTTLGTSPSSGWDQWPGNFAGVYAVCSDNDAIYFGGYGISTILLVKQSFDGTRQWVVPSPIAAWQGPIALARSADSLFMLQPNAMIYRFDSDTSEQTGQIDSTFDLPDSHLPPFLAPKPPTILPHPALWPGACDTDMAADDSQLAISYYEHNAIRWFDPVTGRKSGEISIDSPLGIAFASDGSLLAISDGTVVVVSRTSSTPKLLIAAEPNAYRLAVDKTSGDILVAERSPSNQIKRYDKTGKLLATYGNTGGRRQGLYDEQSFARITGIAAGPNGGFVVSETSAPRRVASFDTTGKVVHQWFGPQTYAPHCEIDPADEKLAWGDSEPGTIVQYALDLPDHKWTVRATYRYDNLAGGIFHDVRLGPQNWHVRHVSGATYLCREDPFAVIRVDETAGRLIPLAAIVTIDRLNDDPVLSKALTDSKTGSLDVLWVDENADGRVGANELTTLDKGVWTSGDGAVIGDDLSAATVDAHGLHRIRLTAWSASGAPSYTVEPTSQLSMPPITDFDPESPATDDAQDIWALYSGEDHEGRNIRGLAQWDVSGQLKFTAAHSVVTASPDRYLARIIGTTHGCVAVSDPVNGSVDVWDQDGLWVGQFLEDPDFAAAPRPAYRLNPLFLGHSVFTDPTTGDVIFVGSGVNNNPAIRISGWDGWQRGTGTIDVR